MILQFRYHLFLMRILTNELVDEEHNLFQLSITLNLEFLCKFLLRCLEVCSIQKIGSVNILQLNLNHRHFFFSTIHSIDKTNCFLFDNMSSDHEYTNLKKIRCLNLTFYH